MVSIKLFLTFIIIFYKKDKDFRVEKLDIVKVLQ